MKIKHMLFAVGLFCIAQTASAQNAVSSLTIEKIMEGNKFVGHLPENIYWGEDNKTIYFRWQQKGDGFKRLYKTDINGSKPVRVADDELLKTPTQYATYNSAKTHKVYTTYGDIFLYDIKANQTQQITYTTDRENNVHFSKDDKHILYQKGNNLYAWEISSGITRQLTNFKSGSEPADYKSEQQKWLERDQLEYFRILKQKKQETIETKRKTV